MVAGEDGQDWVDAARKLAAARDLPIEAFTVGLADCDCDYVDARLSWLKNRGIGPAGVVVVRPDRHVGFGRPALRATRTARLPGPSGRSSPPRRADRRLPAPARRSGRLSRATHDGTRGGEMDRAQRREFVFSHRTCIFGYNRKGDGPAMTVVYYIVDGEDLLVSTMAARAKAKAVRRNPKVSLCVLDEQWPLTYLQVYGDAVIDDDFGRSVDLMRRVIDLMAGQPMPASKLPEIEQMCRDVDRTRELTRG